MGRGDGRREWRWWRARKVVSRLCFSWRRTRVEACGGYFRMRVSPEVRVAR